METNKTLIAPVKFDLCDHREDGDDSLLGAVDIVSTFRIGKENLQCYFRMKVMACLK
jgi:hypothetical protein